MTNEIKEKIEYLKKVTGIYEGARITEIEDYITNLQEENKRLKEENKHIFANVNDDELLISNAMNYAEAQDYKQRIDKAVEYINEFESIKAYYEYEECGYTEYNYDESFKQDLLNILRGDE